MSYNDTFFDSKTGKLIIFLTSGLTKKEIKEKHWRFKELLIKKHRNYCLITPMPPALWNRNETQKNENEVLNNLTNNKCTAKKTPEKITFQHSWITSAIDEEDIDSQLESKNSKEKDSLIIDVCIRNLSKKMGLDCIQLSNYIEFINHLITWRIEKAKKKY